MTESCSERSRALGEPIAGSAAPEISVWIVLEHRGAWGTKAVPESDLPEAVKGRLMGWEDAIEGARVQLVRRSGQAEGPLGFWLGVSDLGGSRVMQWTLASVDAVLEFDLPAWLASMRSGATPEGATEVTQPMLLVCTNGRRDVCCSKLGVPVAQALVEQDGVEVWHTTHLKGHRFAATLLQLPEGLCYGRLGPEDAAGLAQAAQDGTVYRLDRLRGRTVLHPAEQAAESIWRGRTGTLEVDALVHVERREHDGGVQVTLRDRDGQSHQVQLEHRALGPTAPPSCGKAPAPIRGWFVA